MEKLAEMIGLLAKNGLDPDNPPIGFAGGADYPILKGIRMLCRKVTLLANIDGDELVEFDRHLPYGFLHVEAPDIKSNTIISLINKVDFYNAWVLNNMGVFDDDGYEVHICYKPATGLKGLMPKMWPQFEYMVFLYGMFNDLHHEDYRKYAIQEPPKLRLYGPERESRDDETNIE